MTTSLDFSARSVGHHRAAHVASYDVVRGAQQMVAMGDELNALVRIACTRKIGDENTLLLADALQEFDEIARQLRLLAPRIARALAA